MESKIAVVDRIISALKGLNLKKNQRVGIGPKKFDGLEFIKISEKDINDLCLIA